MGKVRRLPDALANQIAAGEVVERPSSVVKELLENALDAGATRLHVSIEEGGVAQIRVTDDGAGMEADDARLALERHATSKIAAFDDLLSLRTFGFRGEALPSIASVSRLTLTTRPRAAAEATRIEVEGGAAPRIVPAGASPGTTVEVRDLFFNVPARRKFLKKGGTEAAHVSEVVLLAALARPDVTLVLERDGRQAREYLRAAHRAERAAQVFGDEPLKRCDGERGPLRLEAYLSPPERARTGAVSLHCFVNGRPVRDRQLARSIAQAYGSVLEAGRYPAGVVYIDLPFDQVDVNVHPQKAEVRFADARAVFDAITRELHGELGKAFSLPAGPLFRPHGAPPASLSHGHGRGFPPNGDGVGSWTFVPGNASPTATAPAEPDPWGLAPALLRDGAALLDGAELPDGAATREGLFAGTGFYGSLTYLAQARGTFLLCEGPDGVYVLDQHAAAERVTFHRLRTAFLSRSVTAQRLLVPEVVELSPAEVAVLEEHQGAAEAMGVELRAVGSSAVAVHAVPSLLVRARPERIVQDLVAELGRAAKRPFSDAADLVLATMACHGSIRAGDAISREEACALLRALDEVDFAGHCPHGRPVVTRLSFGELEQKVGRG